MALFTGSMAKRLFFPLVATGEALQLQMFPKRFSFMQKFKGKPNGYTQVDTEEELDADDDYTDLPSGESGIIPEYGSIIEWLFTHKANLPSDTTSASFHSSTTPEFQFSTRVTQSPAEKIGFEYEVRLETSEQVDVEAIDGFLEEMFSAPVPPQQLKHVGESQPRLTVPHGGVKTSITLKGAVDASCTRDAGPGYTPGLFTLLFIQERAVSLADSDKIIPHSFFVAIFNLLLVWLREWVNRFAHIKDDAAKDVWIWVVGSLQNVVNRYRPGSEIQELMLTFLLDPQIVLYYRDTLTPKEEEQVLVQYVKYIQSKWNFLPQAETLSYNTWASNANLSDSS